MEKIFRANLRYANVASAIAYDEIPIRPLTVASTNNEPDLGLTNHFRLLEISSPLASNEDVLASISIELTSSMPDRHSTMQLEIRLRVRRSNSGT